MYGAWTASMVPGLTLRMAGSWHLTGSQCAQQSECYMLLRRRASLNSNIGWGARLKEAWREISAVLHIRTFQIIILQVDATITTMISACASAS